MPTATAASLRVVKQSARKVSTITIIIICVINISSTLIGKNNSTGRFRRTSAATRIVSVTPQISTVSNATETMTTLVATFPVAAAF